MRENWNRATETLNFSKAELEQLVQPAFGSVNILQATIAEGGLANTNIRCSTDKSNQEYLIHIFTRDPKQARKEFSLSRLIEDTVPTPHSVFFSETNPITDHPYVIRTWVTGHRLEVLRTELNESELRDAGQSIGTALAAVHAYKFSASGFFDGELNIQTKLNTGSAGLIEYVSGCIAHPLLSQRMDPSLKTRLLQFLRQESHILDEWQQPPCLTHADFGGSNILLDDSSGEWQVSAILDWEFAFSGTPFADFGNLLRNPLGASLSFVNGLTRGYKEAGGTLPDNWRKMSLLCDLTAWVEFLTRPEANIALIRDSTELIGATINGWR